MAFVCLFIHDLCFANVQGNNFFPLTVHGITLYYATLRNIIYFAIEFHLPRLNSFFVDTWLQSSFYATRKREKKLINNSVV